MRDPENKLCCRCRSAPRRNDRTAYCQPCMSDYMRERYHANAEARLRQNARCIAYGLLRRGKIQPKPCAVCGSTKRVEMHHDDYSKPREVTWLCFRHHRFTKRTA